MVFRAKQYRALKLYHTNSVRLTKTENHRHRETYVNIKQ